MNLAHFSDGAYNPYQAKVLQMKRGDLNWIAMPQAPPGLSSTLKTVPLIATLGEAVSTAAAERRKTTLISDPWITHGKRRT